MIRSCRSGCRCSRTLGGGRVTVVPGGGGFADCVRQAQAHWRFDDLTAHNMALLAMAQVAQLLHGLEPGLQPVQHEAEIRAALHAGKPALWLPLQMLRQSPDEMTNWDVSSDSLALWLARRLNAERLVVVKSCPIDAHASFDELGQRGVLDRRFAEWARDASFPIEIVGCADLEAVRRRLVGGSLAAAAGWPADGTAPAPAQPHARRRRSSVKTSAAAPSAPRKLPH